MPSFQKTIIHHLKRRYAISLKDNDTSSQKTIIHHLKRRHAISPKEGYTSSQKTICLRSKRRRQIVFCYDWNTSQKTILYQSKRRLIIHLLMRSSITFKDVEMIVFKVAQVTSQKTMFDCLFSRLDIINSK